MTDRKYALGRLSEGDYVCLSNDGKWLWRFTRYWDGTDYGLVAQHGKEIFFASRPFWRAHAIPADSPILDTDEVLESEEWWMHRTFDAFKTRKEAITWALSQSDKGA